MNKEILKWQHKREMELKEIRERIVEMEATIEGVGAQKLTDEPKGGEKPKQEDRIIKLQDEKRYYEELENQFKKEQDEIEKMIRELEDPMERAIMRYRYIRMLSWKEVALEAKKSEDTVKRVHGAVMKKLFPKKTLNNTQKH